MGAHQQPHCGHQFDMAALPPHTLFRFLITGSGGTVQITNVVSLGRDKGSARGEKSNCQVISLLDILEKENQELRRAVIDLSLETLRLREAIGHRARQ